MNKKITALLAVAAVIFFVFAFGGCKTKNNHEINPEFSRYIAGFTYGNITSSSPVIVELTQDVPAVEIGKEVDKDLFKLSPSVKGKAYWESTRTIKFVPEPGELKAGTQYDVIFKLDKVLDVESDFKEFYFNFQIPEQSFDFDLSPYSPMKNNDLAWNSVRGTLTLSDDAKPEDIQKMFSLSDKKARIQVSPTITPTRYNIIIDSLLRTNTDTEYTLTVSGKAINAKTEDKTYKIAIPSLSASDLKVVDVSTGYDPKESIHITFSDPLSSKQNIEGLVKIAGVKNFSYEIQSNVLILYLDTYSRRNNVSLTLHKQLKSINGRTLDNDYTYALQFEQNNPQIKLPSSGNILPDTGRLIIPIQAVNLWAVDVKVIKIFESNILGYLQSNNLGGDSQLRRFGRLILKKRLRLDTDPTVRLEEWNTFSLDLSSMIKRDPGAIYRLEFSMRQEYSLYPCDGVVPEKPTESALERFDTVTDEDMSQFDTPGYYYYDDYDVDWSEYNWSDRDNPCKPTYYMNRKESCVVMGSNMGITAKLGGNKKLMVALTNLVNTEPISGATIDVYNYQMQRIGTGSTNKEGFADVSYEGGVPFAVIASKGKDKGYLKVTSGLSLSLSNFDVSGKEIQKGLKGYIYGERGVWRPGDSIFVTFVLEDKNKMLPAVHPVSLDLYTPRGQLYQRYLAASGQNGFYAFRMATEPDAITGYWRAQVKVGGATFDQSLRIETVKPNRLKVRLDAGDMIDASEGKLKAKISSQWLHGAPASYLRATVEMRLTKMSNPFSAYPKYTFDNPASNFYSDTYQLFDQMLDENGENQVEASLPSAENAPGMLQANIISRVYESGGDASINTQVVPYSPFESYVGIKTPNENTYDWLETDTDNIVDILTVDAKGKPVNRAGINVKVYKLRWSWWWSQSYSSISSYINSTSAEVLMDETISTSGGKGKVKFRIDYPEWGRYLILASDEESGHTAGKIVYVDWPAYRGRSNKQDAMGTTMLSFSTDKNKYAVGEKATVILPKSSNGRALITIEDGSRVISRTWVKTSANEDTKHTFAVTDEMAPNFYVWASLLQPHSQTSNESPIRMYGVLNINVENQNTKLEPVINMPDVVRPEEEFTVSITEKNKKDMTYTLAIVDDGLLDLTSFKTPNAWKEFYARQALGVRTWDLYNMVVDAKTGKFGPLLSIGGGDEDEAEKEGGTNKANNVNRFKPVVKYLGPFTLKGGQTKKHKITLPQYFGSVRVMVVAGNGDAAYGSADKTVQVKNPLMVLSTLPRVAGPGEEILLPVNVFAMDDKIKNVSVSVKSEGLFQFTDGTSKSVSFTKQGDQMVYFKMKVANKTGVEKVTITASGAGETATETIDIEIRNPNPYVVLTSDQLVSAGKEASLSLKMDDLKDGDWVRMEVSRMPGINLNKNLDYLLDYPHGCSEQVTSRVFPLLYISNFMELSAAQKQKMDYNIKEGIRIISARQLSDGGIAYWPGDRYPTEWVTTYAGHFLIEAQRAGYNVPSSVLSKWKSFQKKGALQWNNNSMYSTYYSNSMSDLQQAYRLYTLALAGDAELGAMNRLKEMNNISSQARWRLAAAYMIAGKTDAANQVISGASDIVGKYSFNNDTYGSSTRDMAMIMETYLLMGKTDKALQLSHKVAEGLNGRYYSSTQSSAYALVAMSKLAEKMGQGLVSYEWDLNGVTQKNGQQGRVFQVIDIKPTKKVDVKFRNNGDGELYVRLIGKTQPLEDKNPAISNGINLSVKYTDEDGHAIDVTSLKQGTEFYAKVTLQNSSGQYLTDLALTQIFPSGWEIFNNRMYDEEAEADSRYNYQDVRDDRVMTYLNLGTNYSNTVTIRLQAAYCGRFYLPAVGCEAMYSPDLQGRTTGRWVEVKQ
ncbi:alpha-2-macroglobulin [Dysgonomonas sp. 25]|uniref:alpha-2-macroglobulin family protein n=1 Tax=Dysgonomonas sp. 25 TaxID=2302933 RepID=UPI0013D1E269|nr:MG2 domain-containing protein [Dysgonomonas sp. 25]NDV69778.1 hypothetical protein [Dysgonomonas sp. 25]